MSLMPGMRLIMSFMPIFEIISKTGDINFVFDRILGLPAD